MEKVLTAIFYFIAALGSLATILQFLESARVIEWLTFARILTLIINLCLFGGIALGVTLIGKWVSSIRGDIAKLHSAMEELHSAMEELERAKIAHDTRLGNLERWQDQGRRGHTPTTPTASS